MNIDEGTQFSRSDNYSDTGGTGTLSPDKKLEAYPFGCSMRNTISMKYDAIAVS
jgi:hypothetical protein